MSEPSIVQVNKLNEDWDAQTLFSDWNVRAILVEQLDMVTKINSVARLKKKLSRTVGEEGETWFITSNNHTDNDELYMKDLGIILMWKLQDYENFTTLFERIEHHKDGNE